ncbi:MAG: toprim domain-containing protein [Pseudomonadota bacterium]
MTSDIPQHIRLKSSDYLDQMIHFAEGVLGVRFKPSGTKRYMAYCPFHHDSQDSFRVYVDGKGEVRFHCFGACGGDWDIYDVIMLRKKCRFGQAQEIWADYLGVKDYEPTAGDSTSVPDPGDQSEPDDTASFAEPVEIDDVVAEALEMSTDFYSNLLLSDADKYPKVVAYLERRGVDIDMVAPFRIGWAPPYSDDQYQGRALVESFLPRFNKDFCTFQPFYRAGLLRLLNDPSGKGYGFYRQQIDFSRKDPFTRNYGDFFAGRITFPIHDINGRVAGIIGRRTDNRGVRWLKLQSGEKGISTRSWLYGIDKAARHIQHYRTVILVEGIFDYFAFYNLLQDQDKPVVVSTLGTNLSAQNLGLLTELGTQHFIVAYDWDNAGKRAIQSAAEAIDGQIFYLGGMVEGQDPYDKLKDVAGCISGFSLKHLLAGANKAQACTDKAVGVSFITCGEPGKRSVRFDPFTGSDADSVEQQAPNPAKASPASDVVFSAGEILPLLTYGHGNKVMLDRAVADIMERITAGQGAISEGQTFKLPRNFIRHRIYEQMGPALILWLRIAIGQQRRKRKLRVRDTELSDWLGTSRATIAGYKRTLINLGFLITDTTTRPQVLSVSYFPNPPD